MWVTGVGQTGVGEMLGSAVVVSITGVGHACCDVLGVGKLDTSSMAKLGKMNKPWYYVVRPRYPGRHLKGFSF